MNNVVVHDKRSEVIAQCDAFLENAILVVNRRPRCYQADSMTTAAASDFQNHVTWSHSNRQLGVGMCDLMVTEDLGEFPFVARAPVGIRVVYNRDATRTKVSSPRNVRGTPRT
jgi:hypothetical protein